MTRHWRTWPIKAGYQKHKMYTPLSFGKRSALMLFCFLDMRPRALEKLQCALLLIQVAQIKNTTLGCSKKTIRHICFLGMRSCNFLNLSLFLIFLWLLARLQNNTNASMACVEVPATSPFKCRMETITQKWFDSIESSFRWIAIDPTDAHIGATFSFTIAPIPFHLKAIRDPEGQHLSVFPRA